MVLAYLLLRALDAPNRINLIHIHRTNLRVESRESRENRGRRALRREGSTMVGLGRGGKDEGRTNICPSASWILAPLPSHYSLHSDWITYNQHQTFLNSISCTRNRVFSRFFCVMKPLWEVRGLYSARSPREGSVFVLRADIHKRARRQSLHRNCFLSFFPFFSLFLSSCTWNIRIDIFANKLFQIKLIFRI